MYNLSVDGTSYLHTYTAERYLLHRIGYLIFHFLDRDDLKSARWLSVD